MRRGLVIFQVMAFLVLAGGASAYAYRTNSSVVGTAEPVGDIATIATAAGQPDWTQVMPYAADSTATLSPNASGDQTNISSQFPSSGSHYDKVDEVSPDDAVTYVYTNSRSYQTDLYNLSDLGVSDVNNITSVIVSFRFSGGIRGNQDETGYARAVIKTGGTVYSGDEQTQAGTAFVTRSYSWATNPKTGVAWTVTDINALQAGAEVKISSNQATVRLTWVSVTVSYRGMVISGNAPPGDLFTVTPAPGFLDYLQVRVYLTNTGNLLKAYSQLSLNLYLQDSVEAPGYQVLSLENGGAVFNLPGGLAGSRTLRVVGGSYRLVSANTTSWAAGWTVTPELFPEVSQR